MTGPDERAPLSADALPATGAWRFGDPVGRRRFVALAVDRPFVLEGGGRLRNIEIAYETGYSNPSQFSAFFRKRTGLSPSEFRRSAHGAW